MKLSFSINGACDEINCGRTKIYQEIAAGNIKARKLGKRTIILADDLQAYLESLPSYRETAPTEDKQS